MELKLKKRLMPILATVAVLALAAYGWMTYQSEDVDAGLIHGNGRIEATEIDVATRISGRVEAILVGEGDFVTKGTPLARMQIDNLNAQFDEAQARQRQAASGVDSAIAQVAMSESDIVAAEGAVAQTESELDAARRRLARSETLAREGASSVQELDDDRARMRSAQAALLASKARVSAAQSALAAANTQVTGARATVTAAEATVARIQSDIDDSTLTAPRDGRVQYRIAQPGEVVGAGGKILNLVDLSDVYMNFFVPEQIAGRLAIDSDVRIVLDAAPQFVIPANVSFVSSTAQFTPKTVETASERQKLMFRIKAQIPRDLLQRNLQQVKTGLPGVAWLKIDAQASWPAHLQTKVEP